MSFYFGLLPADTAGERNTAIVRRGERARSHISNLPLLVPQSGIYWTSFLSSAEITMERNVSGCEATMPQGQEAKIPVWSTDVTGRRAPTSAMIRSVLIPVISWSLYPYFNTLLISFCRDPPFAMPSDNNRWFTQPLVDTNLWVFFRDEHYPQLDGIVLHIMFIQMIYNLMQHNQYSNK